eukprot:m.92182 g.92182  ORF g.92182 m.92182 type:complete len:567 (-) comp14938_c0_seq1:1333-3033(-)
MDEQQPLLDVSTVSPTLQEPGLSSSTPESASKGAKRCIRILWIAAFAGILAALFVFVVLPAAIVYHPHAPSAAIVPPSAPSLSLLNHTASHCYLLLFASNSTGSTPIKHYTLSLCANADCTHRNLTLPGVVELEDLTGTTNYTATAIAVNQQLPSNASLPVTFETDKSTVPAQIQHVKPTAATETSLSMSWDPLDCHGATCTTLDIVTNDSLINRTQTQTVPWPIHPSYTIVNLTQGTRYKISLSASNAVGTGPSSSSMTLKTSAANATSPHPPTLLHASNVTASSVVWQWAPTADDGGAQVLHYVLRFHSASTSQWRIQSTNWNVVSTHTTGLHANAEYCGQVLTTTAVANSSWSNDTCVTLPSAEPPGQVDLNRTATTNGTAIKVEYILSNTGGAKQVWYEVERDNWWLATGLEDVGNTSVTSYTSTDLFPSQTYHFRVRAWNTAGAGPWSSSQGYTTAYQGACGNPADAQAYYKTKKTMKASIQGCMISHAASPSKAAECIQQKCGLSQGCSACWVDEGSCTVKNCLGPCINPSSAACKQCSEDKCFPACVVCSGVPRLYFPP